MTTSTLTLSHPHPVQAYFHNLGRAARSFGAALIAVEPRSASEPAGHSAEGALPPLETDPVAKSESVDLLHALANEFDATQPNQAAELRWLASRG